MGIPGKCGKCGRTFKAKDDFAGRVIRCKGCGEMLTVPTPCTEEDWEEPEPSVSPKAAEPPMVNVSCPRCGEVYTRPRDALDGIEDCGKCGEPFLLQEDPPQEPPQDAPAASKGEHRAAAKRGSKLSKGRRPETVETSPGGPGEGIQQQIFDLPLKLKTKYRWLIAAGAGVVVLAGVGVAVLLLSKGQTPSESTIREMAKRAVEREFKNAYFRVYDILCTSQKTGNPNKILVIGQATVQEYEGSSETGTIYFWTTLERYAEGWNVGQVNRDPDKSFRKVIEGTGWHKM